MSSVANRVIKNTGFLYAKMGITMFISLYTTRLILNSLGASDFGIFNIVGGAIAMLGFLNAAMASATQRFMSYSEGEGNKEKQKSIFNVSFILHLCISLVVGIALLIAGLFFFNGILNIPPDRVFAAKVVYGSLIVSTVFTVMTVPYDAAMNAHENMKYYAIVGIFESFLKLAVAFICVYTSFDKLVVYGSLMACIPLVTLTIMRVYCHKHYEECVIAPRVYWQKGLMKEMTSFAGWNFMVSISSVVTQNGLSIVLNNFWGTTLNAAQGVGNQLCGQLQAFSNTMLKAVNPVIAKSEGQNNRHLMLQVSLKGCKFSYLLMIFFSIPATIEMPYIMKIWLHNVPQWAVLFCQLQILRTIIEMLTISLGNAISAHGIINSYSKLASILNMMPLLFTWLLFRFDFAPYWMYVVWISCWSILGGILKLFYCKRLCGLSYKEYLTAVFIPCMVITIIVFCAGYMVNCLFEEGLIRLVCVCLTTTIVFILVGWKLILTKDEKYVIMNILNKFRNKISVLK
ncbi:MATE family efflux transporter [Xylanibacter rarus]|uniref:MATE family efflux transporter n=1 Tax=Xylanibacter rarus TaxID=1676614 RepID=UPI003AB991AF